MYKQILDSLLLGQKYLLFMGMMVCISLCGMDGRDVIFKEVIIPQLNGVKSTDRSWIYYHGQEMLRNLAVVNTVLNKEIENNYRPAKKRIEQWIQEKKIPVIPEKISWNRYFTKCAWIKIRPSFLRKKLELTLLDAADKEIIVRQKTWDNYIGLAVEDMDRPVFSGGSYMVYFYGYGYTFFDPYHGDRRVIEYSLWSDGTAKNKSC